jgi:hypothetical protein
VTLDLLTLAVEGVDALAKIEPFEAVNVEADIDVSWDNAGRVFVIGTTRIFGGRAL